MALNSDAVHVPDFSLRALSVVDVDAVLSLYLAVAAAPGSGLARARDEISRDYIDAVLARVGRRGVSLGAFAGSMLAGEIHAARMDPRQFRHVLTDLTVAVHPAMQGRGLGARLFGALFQAAAALRPRITRIELVARSGNAAALRLYERLGFTVEGRFHGRVKLPDGRVEDDIPMAKAL